MHMCILIPKLQRRKKVKAALDQLVELSLCNAKHPSLNPSFSIKKKMNVRNVCVCVGHKWWVGHLCGRSGRTCSLCRRVALEIRIRATRATAVPMQQQQALSKSAWMEHLTSAKWTWRCTRVTQNFLIP